MTVSACSGEEATELSYLATGSTALVGGAQPGFLYVAHAQQDVVSRFDPATLSVDQVQMVGEPTRIARLGERLFVTRRAARSLTVIDTTTFDGTTAEPIIVGTVKLGTEPFGVVASPVTNKVYVTVSLEDRVVELDADTLEETRRWNIPGEPRGLALHPDGAQLYVVSFRSRDLTRIPLGGGAPAKVTLPTVAGSSATTLRLSGDPAISPDGQMLYVGGIFVSTTNPIPTSPSGSYYAESVGPSPVVIAQPLDDVGIPVAFMAGVVSISDHAAMRRVTGAPSGIAVSPDSKRLAVAIEGADAIVFTGARHDASWEDLVQSEPPEREMLTEYFVGARHYGFEPRAVTSLAAPSGPTSVVFTAPLDAWAFGFIDRGVARLDVGAVDPLAVEDLGFTVGSKRLEEPMVFETTTARLPPSVEEGQRLFFSTTNPDVTRPGTSTNCALCHVDGRDDGVTWTFDIGPRQTPSLAGPVSRTEPVRWQGQRATVAENAVMTSRGMSGLGGLTETQARTVATYIEWTRAPSAREEDPVMMASGREVFDRVGCASCHAGEMLTDNLPHAMLGIEDVRTRSLVGIGATAPYFHDGTAPTLRDVVVAASQGRMGAPFTVTAEETGALVRYLESL